MDTIDHGTSRDISSPRSPRLLSRKTNFAVLAISLFLFYGVGIFVRSNHGIRVIVKNESGTSLKNASVVRDKGNSYPLGEIAAGETKKTFVVPGPESSVRLEFADANGRQHSEIVAGYVENGYCGDVTVGVTSNLKVISHDNSFAMWNWKSWYEFL